MTITSVEGIKLEAVMKEDFGLTCIFEFVFNNWNVFM